jgi:hypothetical protein
MASRISDIGCPRGANREAAHSNKRSREKDKSKRGRLGAGEAREGSEEAARGRVAMAFRGTALCFFLS